MIAAMSPISDQSPLTVNSTLLLVKHSSDAMGLLMVQWLAPPPGVTVRGNYKGTAIIQPNSLRIMA